MRAAAYLLAGTMMLSSLPFNYASAEEENPPQFDVISEENVNPDEDKIEEILKEADPQETVRIIVELSEEPIIENATDKGISVPELDMSTFNSLDNAISDEQDSVKDQIKNKGIELTEIQEFSVAINGFAAEVKAEDLEEIASLPEVKNVYFSVQYEKPEPVDPSMVASVDQIDVKQVWSSDLGYKGEGTIVSIIDTGVYTGHRDFNITDESKLKLSETEVNEIIDKYNLSGVYVSDKVPYAYDYHDNDSDTLENKDSQHGMHVAGTVAANGNTSEGGIKGVAPEAQILAMKVFSDDQNFHSVFTDSYLKAIEESILLGADVVNLSLGASAGIYNMNGDSAVDVAINNAVDNGIICAIAAGNDRNIVDGHGLMHKRNPDLGVVGSPSIYPGSFSVASFENTKTFAHAVLANIGTESYKFGANVHESSPKDAFPNDQEYVYVGLGATDADYEGKDVNGKVALIQRGGATYTVKKDLAAKHGATAAIIFNHKDGGKALVSMLVDPPYSIPVAFIGHDDGMELSGAPEGSKLTLSVDPEFVDNPSARTMSKFSSWGPSSDLRMKPEILAPGGNIYSTQNYHKYKIMSGTSMATPHVAGASAVVKQALQDKFKDLSQKQYAELTKQIMMNTAVPQKDINTGNTYSVMQQGAGMINMLSAVTTPVYIDVTGTNDSIADGKLEIKEISENIFTANLVLHNTSDEAVTYNLESEVLKEEIVDNLFTEDTLEVNSNIIGSNSVTVPANSSTELSVKVAFSGIENNQLVSGFIHLKSDNHPKLTVPFIGFYGDWNAPRIIDGMTGFDEDIYFSNSAPGFYTNYIEKTADKERVRVYALPRGEVDGEKVVFYSQRTNIVPIISVLRNAENMEFNILDKNDKQVSKVNTIKNLKKIHKVSQGRKTYFFSNDMTWDGELRKGTVTEGEIYYYNLKGQLNYNSEPQNYNYPIVLDKSAPKVTFVRYDKETSTVELKVKDDLSGTALVWVGDYDSPRNQVVVNPQRDIENFKEGQNLLFKIPAEWNAGKIFVGVRDNVLNSKTNNFFDLDDSKDTPRITITEPKILTFHDYEVNVSGTITNTENLDKVTLKQVDNNGKLIGTPVDATFEKSGDKYLFSGKITLEGEELNYISVTATAGSLEGNVSTWVFVDKTAPTLDVSHEINDEGNAVFTLNAKDNFWGVMVYELNAAGKTINKLIQKDDSFDKLERKPVDVTTTHVCELEEDEETFYFLAFDFAGNQTKVSYTIKEGQDPIIEIESKTADQLAPGESPVDSEIGNPNDGGTENPESPENPAVPEKPVSPDTETPETPELPEKPEDNKPIDTVKPDIPKIENPVEKPSDGSETKIATTEVAGENRYKTAAQISKELFSSSENVVVASGENYPDALAASVLAAELDAPLLLNPKAKLDADIKAEIERLGAKQVYLIGGENTLTNELAAETETLGLKVERIAGDNRYSTASKITEKVKELSDKSEHIILASGNNYADALAAAPYAGVESSGILLTDKDRLDDSTLKALEGVKKVTIVGGESSVSAEVAKVLEEKSIEANRIAGLNRYETASKIGTELFKDTERIVIASGENYPDALAGSVLAISEKAPILLVSKDNVPDEVSNAIKTTNAIQIYILGGENTISNSARNILKNIEK